LITILVAGPLYQMLASQQDLQQHPPPGELIGVGNHRLHIYCMGHKQGEGSPTVVLQAGQGDNWLDWSPVQGQIAAFAQVCAYDRAGLGWSDPLASPVPGAQVARSVRPLLHHAGIEGPYILAVISLGASAPVLSPAWPRTRWRLSSCWTLPTRTSGPGFLLSLWHLRIQISGCCASVA
jgi:hypothetical protein